jgi:hypothetical protein
MGSLEEIAGLFIDDITHDNIDTTSRNKMIFDFDKHKKIYQLLSPTKEKPFLAASLKWSLWQTPSKLLLNDRDFCCLEYMDEFIDDHGRRGWARAVKSIEHPSCPPPPLKTTTPSSSNGPIRGEVNCLAIVAKENNAIHGIVDVQMVLQMDTHGIPSKLAQVFIKSKIKNMLNLNHILMISRKQQQQHSLLSSSVLLSSTLSGSYREIPDECTTSYHSFSSMAPAALSSSSKDKNNKKKCSCCRFHISRWSKTRRCRVCNEILCKKCYTLSYSVADSRCDRLCYSCAHKIRSYNANEIPLLESNRSVIFSHYDDAEEEEDAQEIDKSSVFLLNDSIDDTMSVYSMANSDHYGLMNRNTSSTSISPKERVASSFVAPHTTPVGARSTMMNQNKPTQFNNGYDHTRSKKCDLSYLKNILPASSIRSTKYDK